jgi:CHAD domain-containing protein
MQDASIRDLCRDRGDWRLSVRVPGYEGNAAAGQAKADLWKAKFGAALTVETQPLPLGVGRYEGVVGAQDTVLDGARKLLWREYRTMGDHLNGAADPDAGTRSLHDLRVGMRRFRAVVRAFRGPLAVTDAAGVRRALDGLCNALGPARDADASWEFLHRDPAQEQLRADPATDTFLEHWLARRRRRAETVKALVRSPLMREVKRRTAWLLRVEIPRVMGDDGDSLSLRRYGARKLLNMFCRIQGLQRPDPDGAPETLHDVRRVCRRERYLAEFLEPALRPYGTDLAERVRAVVDALGLRHDMDVLADELTRAECPVPAALPRLVADTRASAGRAFAEAWERLREPCFREQTMGRLEAWRRGD